MRSILEQRLTWSRLAWLSLGILFLLGARELFLRGLGTGNGEFLGNFSQKWGLGLIAFGIFGIGVLGVAITGVVNPDQISRWLNRAGNYFERWPKLRWLMAAGAVIFPAFLMLGPWGWRFDHPTFRLSLIVLVGLISAIFIPPRIGNLWIRWAISSLIITTILTISGRFILVSDLPFPLGWSEGNRLWDYSLYFGVDRYTISGEFSYPTYLTPGRHGLWGLPFLIFPDISIQGMRFWDAILWTFPYLLLGAVVFLRRSIQISTPWKWMLTMWTLLFISQGPIYAPLIFSAVMVVWGYDANKPWRSIFATFIAALYAGLSRWTWMVAPAIWVGALALLDESSTKPFLQRLKKPFILGTAGILGAVSSQIIMNVAFPRPDAIYSTSLSQPLLWDRLWSSATNPTGIVPGLLYAIGPLVIFLVWAGVSKFIRLDATQISVILISFIGFLGIGLVASVKIGGGSNLHNLDMLLVTLVLLVGAIVWKISGPIKLPGYVSAILALVWFMPILNLSYSSLSIDIPIWETTRAGQSLDSPSEKDAKEALASIRYEVSKAADKGEVLFLDQRQLLTFGEITDVPLVMDYELKHVMNQAMGQNSNYFELFRRDLENHRFSMIVSDPLYIVFQGSKVAFGEENDAWVEQVTIPILEYYEPVAKFDKVLVWLLAPIEEVEE